MTEYCKAKCPKCGSPLAHFVLTCNPPIHIARCPACGFEKEVDLIDTEKQPEKPPIGCKPYVTISERIDELYDAIRRIIAEKEKHNQVKFWSYEISLLNEMVRYLRHAETEKTWIEDNCGTPKEGEMMPDRNKVIKNLKWFRDRKSWREGIMIHDDHAEIRKQICDNAIALLEKNEPVQPLYINTSHPFHVGIAYQCGNCHCPLDRDKDLFCHRCGKPVDWEKGAVKWE